MSFSIILYRFLLKEYDFIGIWWNIDCGPLDATNASKHSIDQSEERNLQINQSRKASKHS